MCGIVYYKSLLKENVVPNVITRYYQQRNRGTEGFGFYIPQMNRLTHNVREARILDLLRNTETPEVLFHHRMPTSTPNVRNACHPFSTGNFFNHNYVMVHNGIAHNDYKLEASHAKLGIQYISLQTDGKFNDSEALLYDIALYLEGRQNHLEVEGSVAFVLIENDKRGRPLNLHFGRNESSPLYLEFTDKSINLASESKWGTGATSIMPNYLYSFNYRSHKLSLKSMKIAEYHRSAQYAAAAYAGGATSDYLESNKRWYEEPYTPIPANSSWKPNRRKKIKLREIYDADTDTWVSLGRKIDEDYFETMSLKMTDKFIDEGGSIIQAIQLMQDALDSAEGKIQRLSKDLLNAGELVEKRRLRTSRRMLGIGLSYLESMFDDESDLPQLEADNLSMRGV